jgi:hypothetical protein
MPTTSEGALAVKPDLAIRVGVTGHRDLSSAEPGALEERVGQVLRTIEASVASAQSEARGDLLSASASTALMQLVTPLAEGADRLAARVAVERKWRLLVPMPFSKTEYQRDFPNSIAEFESQLAVAASDERGPQIVTLAGNRNEANEAYLQVGRFVVRNCHLLLAIWNGQTEKGRGGTAQIVRIARRYGIPIIHIDSWPPHAMTIVLREFEEPYLAISLSRIVKSKLAGALGGTKSSKSMKPD